MSDHTSRADDAEMNGGPGDRKPRRWVRWALIASLALNVLFIGFAASRAYHFGGHHWRGHSPVGQVMRQGGKFVHDLPRERRRELWAMIKQRRGEFKLEREKVDEAVDAFAAALEESPYDPKKTEQALMLIQDQAELMITRGRGVTMEVIGELTSSERAEFADRLRNRKRK